MKKVLERNWRKSNKRGREKCRELGDGEEEKELWKNPDHKIRAEKKILTEVMNKKRGGGEEKVGGHQSLLNSPAEHRSFWRRSMVQHNPVQIKRKKKGL